MTVTAFQPNAFQNNAFQISSAVGCQVAFQPSAFQDNAFQTCVSGCQVAFQISAYQVNAFQTCSVMPAPPVTKKVVGWPDTLRRKVPRETLERLLELQKNATFGRKWFEEFEEAQHDFAAAEARAAVEVAARESREAAELIHEQIREEEFADHLRQVALTLEITREVRRVRDVMAAANHASAMARALKAHLEFEEDEETAIMLLLH